MNKENNLIYQSAEYLATQIRQKEVSAVEIAEAFLAQIEQVNPKINAIMQVDADRVLQDAKACDAELFSGRLRGALHGVPVSIKDNLLTEQMMTTGGSFAFLENKPKQDATVVRRLRDNGAIILGKTNLPDFALSWETESTALGRTNNPYHLDYTAGGSSGGEAAILAAGGSPLGIGTDSGGSIRLPAHYCGVAGLRTSHGLIPSTGHMPPTEGFPVLGVFACFNSIGPMSRNVSDLLYVLPILMGRDGIDPYADYDPLVKPEKINTQGLRVALYTGVQGQVVEPEIEAAVLKVAECLIQKGAIVEAVEPPGLCDARDIYCRVVGADGGDGIIALLKELKYERYPANLDKVLTRMPKNQSVQQVIDARIEWDLYRMNLLTFMQSFDVILCPVASHFALPHGHTLVDPIYFEKENYLIPYSLMGWPSVVIPMGVGANGLPMGVQLVGKYRKDYELVMLATALSQRVS